MVKNACFQKLKYNYSDHYVYNCNCFQKMIFQAVVDIRINVLILVFCKSVFMCDLISNILSRQLINPYEIVCNIII